MKSLSIALSRIKNLAKIGKEECLHFVFPAFCLHCEETKVMAPKLFCSFCEEWIYRFPLDKCLENKAFTFEKEGIALSLFRERKGALASEVLATLAAFMALQIVELKWPSFDFIVPSPKDPTNLPLGEKLSDYLKVPLKNCLKAEEDWDSYEIFSDKTLLVVDIAFSFSDSLIILEEACPFQIYYVGLFIP